MQLAKAEVDRKVFRPAAQAASFRQKINSLAAAVAAAQLRARKAAMPGAKAADKWNGHPNAARSAAAAAAAKAACQNAIPARAAVTDSSNCARSDSGGCADRGAVNPAPCLVLIVLQSSKRHPGSGNGALGLRGRNASGAPGYAVTESAHTIVR